MPLWAISVCFMASRVNRNQSLPIITTRCSALYVRRARHVTFCFPLRRAQNRIVLQ